MSIQTTDDSHVLLYNSVTHQPIPTDTFATDSEADAFVLWVEQRQSVEVRNMDALTLHACRVQFNDYTRDSESGEVIPEIIAEILATT